ncbi:hypothetical protein [Priestia aryabhattai]|uniref:hypothetical protein n=1 Tax=Priestia aryabhattai TaxID=412384 RepID=UPI0023809C94|nr:hypothetical protein [Priestia aryabhattai]WDW11566.1 hypothetical protein PWC21_26980 [Priestia aryabhattai]
MNKINTNLKKGMIKISEYYIKKYIKQSKHDDHCSCKHHCCKCSQYSESNIGNPIVNPIFHPIFHPVININNNDTSTAGSSSNASASSSSSSTSSATAKSKLKSSEDNGTGNDGGNNGGTTTLDITVASFFVPLFGTFRVSLKLEVPEDLANEVGAALQNCLQTAKNGALSIIGSLLNPLNYLQLNDNNLQNAVNEAFSSFQNCAQNVPRIIEDIGNIQMIIEAGFE